MVTQPNPRHRGHRSLPAVALASALVFAGCGGTDTSVSGPSVEPQNGVDTAGGPMTDSIELPDSFEFSFATGADDADQASTGSETDDPARDSSSTDDGGTLPPSVDEEAHPLESTVIDTVVVDEQDPPFLDEAGALACAHTEMALDAIIDGTDDLDSHLDTAADWAAQSEVSTLSAHTDDLASQRDGTSVEALVVAVLGSCATVGYEL